MGKNPEISLNIIIPKSPETTKANCVKGNPTFNPKYKVA